MTKSEVLAKLKVTDLINKFQRDNGGLWQRAFDLYNEAHPKEKKSPTCGHCFRAVSAWLVS